MLPKEQERQFTLAVKRTGGEVHLGHMSFTLVDRMSYAVVALLRRSIDSTRALSAQSRRERDDSSDFFAAS
jgi:hypothetical protein